MYKLHISERLRELRVKSGYTQSQIAKILNIDRSTYSYYELGKTTPDISVLVTLSKVFNIPINELLADESTPKSVAERGRIREYTAGKKNSSHIYELSEEEKELIGIYRVCSKEQQKAVLRYLQNAASSGEALKAPAISDLAH